MRCGHHTLATLNASGSHLVRGQWRSWRYTFFAAFFVCSKTRAGSIESVIPMQGNIPFDIRRLFGWQRTNTLAGDGETVFRVLRPEFVVPVTRPFCCTCVVTVIQTQCARCRISPKKSWSRSTRTSRSCSSRTTCGRADLASLSVHSSSLSFSPGTNQSPPKSESELLFFEIFFMRTQENGPIA